MANSSFNIGDTNKAIDTLSEQITTLNSKLFSVLVTLTYTNGVAEYINASITTATRVFAIRQVNAVATNYVVGAIAENGKAIIALNNAVSAQLGTIIFIDNR